MSEPGDSTAALADFRKQAHRWMLDHAPKSLLGTRTNRFAGYWGGRKSTESSPDILRWRDVCVERGWTAPTWPREYGGGGLSKAEGEVVEDLLRELKLPPAVTGFGMTMIGPTLLDYGNEEQKKEHLPRICRGEIRWCQGYSEPGAGSDLASLSTRAVSDGDDFIVSGQKIWTSYADLSDWIFCLVRTDPEADKHNGISFVLFDMETPGVTVRQIKLISGSSPFCEVFLEDVRVPRRNMVGKLNGGWTVAKALLGYERSMIGEAISGQLRGVEQDLVALARRHLSAPDGPLPLPHLRHEIAQNAMEERAFMLTLLRIQQSRQPGPESSTLKICGSELKQKSWELAMRIAAEQSLGWEGPGFEAVDMANTREWLRSRANTIEGGSTEIQLNVIAKQVLGLKG